jgi:hypothetical protein
MVGLAVVVVLFFALWMVQSFIPFGTLFASLADTDATGVQHLSVGQCLNGARPDPAPAAAIPIIHDADVVDCATPHDSELVASFDYPVSRAAAYPGFDVVSSYAQAECGVRFSSYVGVRPEDTSYGLTFIPPMEFNWDVGDRAVQCLVHPPDGHAHMTGSVRNSRR